MTPVTHLKLVLTNSFRSCYSLRRLCKFMLNNPLCLRLPLRLRRNVFLVPVTARRALSKTEEAYLEMADKAVAENPELALMGSCVLVMLMKGEDVYVMKVGDNQAILAKKLKPDLGEIVSISQAVGDSRPCRDLERISEGTSHDLEAFDDCSNDMDLPGKKPTLGGSEDQGRAYK